MASLFLWLAAWMAFSVLVAALPAWVESVTVSSVSPRLRRGAWFLLALRAAVPLGFVPLVLPSFSPSMVPATNAGASLLPPGTESVAPGLPLGGGGPEGIGVLVAVYGLGLLVVGARDFRGRRAWRRALRTGVAPSARVQALVDTEVSRMNLVRCPRVIQVPGVPSPCLSRLFRPLLVLPDEGRFTDAELSWMVRHELEHFRSGDLWWTAAVQVLTLGLWFLPGLWWIAARFRSATEEACDGRVLGGCEADLRQSYALTLLKLVEPVRPLQRGTAMASSVSRLKQRLGLICHPRRSSVPALVLLATVVLVSGAWGAGVVPVPGMPPLTPGWPFAPGTPCWVTSGYGEMENPITKKPYFHQGIDLAARTNTPVLTPWPGTVTQTGFDVDQGYFLTVDLGGGWSLLASHFAAAPPVTGGQVVESNQVVGLVGSTGRSTGPHVHLEVWKDGVPVDPTPFLAARDGPSGR